MTAPGDQLNVLLIEDNPGDVRLIRELLRDARVSSFRLDVAETLAEGIEKLAAADVALLDLTLPDSQGLETFSRTREAAPKLPIVVLSGLNDELVALEAVQTGAQDYLVKGMVDGRLLVHALRYAVERERLEEQRAELLAREQAALRELERQKDEFFANISHDLRTPLFAIKVSIGVVLANEPPGTPEPIRRLFANIDLACDQMAKLVDDLLELSRLQAGRVRLQLENWDLGQLARRALVAVEPLVQKSGQRLEVDLPDRAVIASVDGARLERALLNLLSNAQKYGRPHGTIRLGLQRGASEVAFTVQDDGPGIPLADQGRIFERYFRPESETTRATEGSGLGLSIARGIVELHGGRIWVESRPGAGATFGIALPSSRTAGHAPRSPTSPRDVER
jgi:signal transduction histidine kinase